MVIATVSSFPTIDQHNAIKPHVGTKPFPLRESVTGGFEIKGFSAFQWISESKFLYRKNGDIYTFDVANNNEVILVTGAQLV